MGKVYLVYQGDWEGSIVLSVHSTREKAQEVVDYVSKGRNMEFPPVIGEMDLDVFEMQSLPEGKSDYTVLFCKDGERDWYPIVETGTYEVDRDAANEGKTEAWVVVNGQEKTHWRFSTAVWATDDEDAVKIARERLDAVTEWEEVQI